MIYCNEQRCEFYDADVCEECTRQEIMLVTLEGGKPGMVQCANFREKGYEPDGWLVTIL